ncbi:outer membrane protein assembly factor BamE [Portibacter lacus]|uniref:Uncharacterized protein n=1 Tax=Portibacter lacus TaxID=1099794 RepID=A0AA37SSX0_9BACT|nr:outer membrane protein assembly factor BamE [Portibacter lacus]GLR19507.1 hypothetical protein GCM10007940_41230 [Portibacter lacus]
MKENIKDIKPGIGLGDLIFGMNKDQVKAVLGTPDETEMQTFSEEELDSIEIWHYDDFELSLSFSEEEDWKLYTISINAEFYTLNDEEIMYKDIEDIKSKLVGWDFTDLAYEDLSNSDGPSQKLISSECSEISFWFDDNLLSEIQWSPVFEDEDTINWPEIPA